MSRVTQHPVLRIPQIEPVTFRFAGKTLTARRNEMISAFSAGIPRISHRRVFSAPTASAASAWSLPTVYR